nr:DNA-binding domain-containing protein [Chryseobacterium taichungense]
MANILHKIKAYLYDNTLTEDNPNDFIARTASERSLSVKQICEAAVVQMFPRRQWNMQPSFSLKKWPTSCVMAFR